MAREVTVEEMQAPDVDYILPDGREIPDGLRKAHRALGHALARIS